MSLHLHDDVLHKMETQDIIDLKQFYKDYKDKFPHIYSYIKTVLKWQKTNPEYVSIYSVSGDFKEDGTFIAINTFSCYDIILHSMEKSCEKIHRGLTQTKRINWFDYEVFFYAIHERFKPIILKSLKDLNVSLKYYSTTYLWQVMEEKALQINDSFDNDNFYIDVVKPHDAETINAAWSSSYDTSLEYLRTFIIMNGGYGIYEKGSDKLVAWVLCNILGQIGVLQTQDGYFKKGFGSILTRKLAKVISGQNGDHPIGTVDDGNIASEKLFSRIGFEKKFACNYIRALKKI